MHPQQADPLGGSYPRGLAANLAAQRLERSSQRQQQRRVVAAQESGCGNAGRKSCSSVHPPIRTKSQEDARGESSAVGPAARTPARRATEAELATDPGKTRVVEMAAASWRSSWSNVSIEGLLHENHDRGAGALLGEGSSVFAVLDGHGTEGAALSHLCQRSLFDATRQALVAEGKSAEKAITEAFGRTAAMLPHASVDCRCRLSQTRGGDGCVPAVLSGELPSALPLNLCFLLLPVAVTISLPPTRAP